MNEIYAEMIVFEPNVMNFDLSRLIEHFWYNLLYNNATNATSSLNATNALSTSALQIFLDIFSTMANMSKVL